jgi:hypothetical protein
MDQSALGPLRSILLLASVLISFGCGSGSQLRSVSVSPSAADAKNFANGQVQFSAVGTFNNSSMPQPLNNNPDQGQQMTVFGAAQLSCP